jgi:tRNA(fMet)-specific endonuclease VapC
MRVLLDTSAYAALMRGHTGVVERVRRSEEVLLSIVVAGELFFGFRRGNRYERNLEALDLFIRNPRVSLVPVTLTTAERFGRIASALRRKGTPIPTNDIWIAAHAMETGADLLSFDRHFEMVDGIAWVDPGGG